ncbi:hypothetical protein [Vibrio phage VP-1]|uniref:Uncharacterized protein n=1 Tax=Vibrio phage VP-1 TaxID=2234088 RepID=A0A4P2TEA4_9CAUD|nr:hypothetical protein [Vibrio phage VP-1]
MTKSFLELLSESDVELVTEAMITEAFNQEPYDYTLEQPRTDNIFAIFQEEDGSEFRIQFYSSVGLGKGVRRVRIGRKAGGKNSFTDAGLKFKNPARVIATMIAASEEFFTTPVGKKADGYAFELTKKAAPRGVRVIRQVMKRKFRQKFTTLDSTFSPEEGKSFIWVLRKGKKAEDVFNGPKNKGFISDDGEITPPNKRDEQKEIAELLFPKPFKEMTGVYSGSYNNAYRLVVEYDGTLVASKGGTEFGRIERKEGESPRKFVTRASAQLGEWQTRMEKGEWDEGYRRWKDDVVKPTVKSTKESAEELVQMLRAMGFEDIKDVSHKGWPDYTFNATAFGKSYTFMPGREEHQGMWAFYPGGSLYRKDGETNFTIEELRTEIEAIQREDTENTKTAFVNAIKAQLIRTEVGDVKSDGRSLLVNWADTLKWDISIEFDKLVKMATVGVNGTKVHFANVTKVKDFTNAILKVIDEDIRKHEGDDTSDDDSEVVDSLTSIIKSMRRTVITADKQTAATHRVDFSLSTLVKGVAKLSFKTGKIVITRTDDEGYEFPKLQFESLSVMPRGESLRAIMNSGVVGEPAVAIDLIYNSIIEHPLFHNVKMRGAGREKSILFEDPMYGATHVITAAAMVHVRPFTSNIAVSGYSMYVDLDKWQKVPNEMGKTISTKTFDDFESTVRDASGYKSESIDSNRKPTQLKHNVIHIPQINENVTIKEITFGRAWEISYGEKSKLVTTGKQFDEVMVDIRWLVATQSNSEYRQFNIPEWQRLLMDKLTSNKHGLVFRVLPHVGRDGHDQEVIDDMNYIIKFTGGKSRRTQEFGVEHNERTSMYYVVSSWGDRQYAEFEHVDDLVESIYATLLAGNGWHDMIMAIDDIGNGEYTFERPEFLSNMDASAIPDFEALLGIEDDAKLKDIISFDSFDLTLRLGWEDMPKVRNTFKKVVEVLKSGREVEELREEMENDYGEATSILMMETIMDRIHKNIDNKTLEFVQDAIANSALSKEDADQMGREAVADSDRSAVLHVNRTAPAVNLLSSLYRLCNNKTTFKRFKTDESGRAYYSNATGEIAVTGRFDFVTLWHEFGHSIEYSDRRILKGSKDILEKEATSAVNRGSQAFVRLRDVEHSGYGENEIAVNGNFINYYTGRVYSNRIGQVMAIQEPSMVQEVHATEIISMGLQYLTDQDDVSVGAWAKKNPHHYRFVMSVINQLHKGL